MNTKNLSFNLTEKEWIQWLGLGLMHSNRQSWEGQWEWRIARKTLEQGDKDNRSWATSGCRCSRAYHRHGVTADGEARKCAVKIFKEDLSDPGTQTHTEQKSSIWDLRANMCSFFLNPDTTCILYRNEDLYNLLDLQSSPSEVSS